MGLLGRGTYQKPKRDPATANGAMAASLVEKRMIIRGLTIQVDGGKIEVEQAKVIGGGTADMMAVPVPGPERVLARLSLSGAQIAHDGIMFEGTARAPEAIAGMQCRWMFTAGHLHIPASAQGWYVDQLSLHMVNEPEEEIEVRQRVIVRLLQDGRLHVWPVEDGCNWFFTPIVLKTRLPDYWPSGWPFPVTCDPEGISFFGEVAWDGTHARGTLMRWRLVPTAELRPFFEMRPAIKPKGFGRFEPKPLSPWLTGY